MRPSTLRRRLYTVLVQWFLLLVLAAGVVVFVSFSGVRRSVVDDRLVLARTIAQHLDVMISMAIQDLGRLASDLPALNEDAAGRLRVFRFQSPFREATYLLDARARMLASDPADARPLPALGRPSHEVVTPLVQKPGSERPVLAIVQPFQRAGASYYLVSEMNPVGSIVSTFLHDLGLDPETRVAVIDESGTVIASPDPQQLLRTLPHAGAYAERIRAHRPLVREDLGSDDGPRRTSTPDALTVMAPLRFAPWGVVIQQPRTRAFSGFYTARRGLVAAGVMLALMGLLLARALSRSVVAPIQQLSRQAAVMRTGDLSRPIGVSGDLEVEVLAETLDEARRKLASTLSELTELNEDLEGQVATRTRAIEARYRDLKLLQAVAQVSTQERDPDRVIPAILDLIAAHWSFPVVALVARPPEGPATTYVMPAGTAIPWLAAGGAPPPDWQRDEIAQPAGARAELVHPRRPDLDREVMGALEHQLAISLHGAYLWRRTLAQDEQRQVLVRRLLHATEEERRRLARELHDEIAQLLTVIQLSLERVDVDAGEMTRAKSLLAETQEEIHRIIYDLRPSLLDDLGLAAAIKAHAQDHLVGHGLTVSLEIDEGLPSRPAIEITTFRIYQELVTNILRHAEAEHVSIELYERDGTLVLAVEDDGKGFDPGEKVAGAGLTGMRERAALVNGSIRFDSEAGMGTHVVLEIPVR